MCIYIYIWVVSKTLRWIQYRLVLGILFSFFHYFYTKNEKLPCMIFTKHSKSKGENKKVNPPGTTCFFNICRYFYNENLAETMQNNKNQSARFIQNETELNENAWKQDKVSESKQKQARANTTDKILANPNEYKPIRWNLPRTSIWKFMQSKW